MKNNKKQSTSNTRIKNMRVRVIAQKMIKFFIATVLFCGYNFTVFAETLTVRTITEALNYSGNINTVTKLIITDAIAGNDYSVGSEWSKFRTLDETFPNIETVEILTDQDIPDFDETNQYSLFCWSEYVPDPWWGHYVHHSSKWLKNFSAPNMKNISSRTFAYCENLINVNFPLAETIGEGAFIYCKKLSAVNFPLAATIKNYAFNDCSGLISADFPLAQTIGHGAFWSCDKLTSINFPLAKTIESLAFCYCGSLVTVDFPLVQTIGYDAFSTCYSLVTMNFPLLQTIGNRAFSTCSGLISVAFPSVQTIGHSAFQTCLNLTSIKFPLVQTVENYAFYSCNSLVSVSFGTAFEEETEIKLKARVFLSIGTGNIDLTLGKYVLPVPNLSAKIWQNTNGSYDGTSHLDFDYIWKSITVKEVEITTVSLPFGTVGKEYSEQLFSVSTAPITWSIDGALPLGLSFSSLGLISGVPTEAGTANFTVKVEGASGEDTQELSITIKNAVGIVETLTTQIKIYPNPTTGELRIENGELRINSVEVYDVYGRKISSNHLITSSSHQVNISHLPAGVYFVKIRTEAGKVVRKVVKE